VTAGAAATARAGEVMTTPVVTVSPDTPTGEIAEALGRHRISAVPVVDEAGAVVGLVSEYDLLAEAGGTASEVMTTAVVSVTEDTDVADVRQLLVERRIRRVPVLAGGRLVRIVAAPTWSPWWPPNGCVRCAVNRSGANVRPRCARNVWAAGTGSRCRSSRRGPDRCGVRPPTEDGTDGR
jgi:hypothetical protein